MTTTTVISGQTFGTSTNVGNAKFSIAPVTLQASTTAYVVQLKWTAGASIENRGSRIVVWYTTTAATVTAGNAPTQLNQTARYVDLVAPQSAAGVQIRDSSLEPVTGNKFHCWVEAPNLSVAATLDVVLVELP